jgi:hypothetical protein
MLDTEKGLAGGYLYVLTDYNSISTYKIGVTIRPIDLRVSEINQSPGSCVRLKYLSPPRHDYRAIERKLHKYFKNNQTKSGENKSLSEWFYFEDLTDLKKILLYEFGTTFSDFPLT